MAAQLQFQTITTLEYLHAVTSLRRAIVTRFIKRTQPKRLLSKMTKVTSSFDVSCNM